MLTKPARNLYLITCGLFWLTAAINALSHSFGSAAIWVALGAVFLALAYQK